MTLKDEITSASLECTSKLEDYTVLLEAWKDSPAYRGLLVADTIVPGSGISMAFVIGFHFAQTKKAHKEELQELFKIYNTSENSDE